MVRSDLLAGFEFELKLAASIGLVDVVEELEEQVDVGGRDAHVALLCLTEGARAVAASAADARRRRRR